MGTASIRQMAQQVAGMIEDRLGVAGASLSDKLRTGGGKLPRKVRLAASLLAEADEMAMSPKLHARVDEARINGAYKLCMRHLGKLKSERRAKTWADIMGSIGFAIFVILAGLLTYLVWRGYV